MIVELDPIAYADLAAGPVTAFAVPDGAVIVSVTARDAVATIPAAGDAPAVIAAASLEWPEPFAKVLGATWVATYSPAVADDLLVGLMPQNGSRLVDAWLPDHVYGDPLLFADAVFGAGHIWTQSGGLGAQSGSVEPDWASNFGGSVTDGGVTWQDAGTTSDNGSVSLVLELGAPSASVAGDAYADTDELARILKIRNPTAEQLAALERVLVAAALEIDAELDRAVADALVPPFPALVVEVNLERAQELWQQSEATLGFIGIGAEAGPARIASNTWEKHALKLAPLKLRWGIA